MHTRGCGCWCYDFFFNVCCLHDYNFSPNEKTHEVYKKRRLSPERHCYAEFLSAVDQFICDPTFVTIGDKTNLPGVASVTWEPIAVDGLYQKLRNKLMSTYSPTRNSHLLFTNSLYWI